MKDEDIQRLIDKTFNKLKNTGGGKNASYIPELAKADPKLFGISFVSCMKGLRRGQIHHSCSHRVHQQAIYIGARGGRPRQQGRKQKNRSQRQLAPVQ